MITDVNSILEPVDLSFSGHHDMLHTGKNTQMGTCSIKEV